MRTELTNMTNYIFSSYLLQERERKEWSLKFLIKKPPLFL